MNDPVNHPNHYTFGKYEVIQVLDDWNLPFCLANAIKYIARAGKKGDRTEDLKKAVWYLTHEIEKVEPKQPEQNPVWISTFLPAEDKEVLVLYKESKDSEQTYFTLGSRSDGCWTGDIPELYTKVILAWCDLPPVPDELKKEKTDGKDLNDI